MAARLIGVFGPFQSQALVEMPAEDAAELVGGDMASAGRVDILDAVRRDLEVIAERDEALARSTLAEAAVALAYELANPYNSATSKSMCARELREHMSQLRELLPPEKEADKLDELAARRTERRGEAGAAAQLRP